MDRKLALYPGIKRTCDVPYSSISELRHQFELFLPDPTKVIGREPNTNAGKKSYQKGTGSPGRNRQ